MFMAHWSACQVVCVRACVAHFCHRWWVDLRGNAEKQNKATIDNFLQIGMRVN